MGIVAQCEGVGTRIKLPPGKAVAVCVIAVVARHGACRHGKRHILGLAWGEKVRLGVVSQHHRALLDAACRIGRAAVELDHVSPCNVTGVGDANGDRGFIAKRRTLWRCVDHLPVERRVGEPVAKRVLDHALVARAVLVGHAVPEALGVRRLVPLVAHVDALGVVHVRDLVVALRQREVAVEGTIRGIEAVGLRVGTHVLACARVARGGREVIRVRIHRAAGRVYLPPQDTGQRLGSVLAGIAREEHRVDAGRGLEGSQRHRVCRVHDHDDVLVRRANVGEKRLLLGREVEGGPGGVRDHRAVLLVHLVLDERHVVALARVALQHHDGGVREVPRVSQQLLRVARAVRNRGLKEHARLLGLARKGLGTLPGSTEVLVHAR